ncbi:hypothetical protein ACFE04_011508 [Oxalis oulophora]
MEQVKQGHGAIYITLTILLSLFTRIQSLALTVNDIECVSEYVLFDGDTVSGNFVVVDHDIFWNSDHPGIDFSVTSTSTGSIVHTIKGTSGDSFEFKAPRSGMYKFCFHNPHPTPESVSFYIHVGHIPGEHDLAKDEHLNPVNVQIAELRESLESIITEQKYLKARETRHRYTNESTRKRVIGYTLTEYFLFASLSALQVFYIRYLFGRSVAYNRI